MIYRYRPRRDAVLGGRGRARPIMAIAIISISRMILSSITTAIIVIIRTIIIIIIIILLLLLLIVIFMIVVIISIIIVRTRLRGEVVGSICAAAKVEDEDTPGIWL